MTAPSNKHAFKAPVAIFMGPQRAGTSWIHRYFSMRPDICLPKGVKELFFFDTKFQQGKDFYFSHFKEESQHKLVMEVSATYFMDPDAPRRIFEYFGEHIKLVCPLRHPVQRSYSLYKHFLRYRIVEGSLYEACEQNPNILLSSHYKAHIENWMEYYNLNDIYICYQEDLAADQEKFLRGICKHLEIPYTSVPKEAQNYLNVATRPPVSLVAKIAQIGASKLRALRLYWIINFAKSLGLKKVIFGAELEKSSSEDIPEADRLFLEEKLGEQIPLLEKFLGYPIVQWR